ncbi:unnamed protein product [Vicia faba]|uniref:Uncharacterized protein n=1 Tax=Vicia faba TaxID=3906 RepID=A0AAV1B920_VICFA|nr:unnamed protein product [Vicia faba]
MLRNHIYHRVRLLRPYQVGDRGINGSIWHHGSVLRRWINRFTPVDTSSGRLCLKVIYCPSASNLIRNRLHSLFPPVIPDYVGSPLADPLRKFSSLSPRRRSSNFDDCKASSTSITDSSLPIYSKSHISV